MTPRIVYVYYSAVLSRAYLSGRRGQDISSCPDRLFWLWGLFPRLPDDGKERNMLKMNKQHFPNKESVSVPPIIPINRRTQYHIK